MALSGTLMGNEVVTAIGITAPPLSPADLIIVQSKWQAICTAIVTHIQVNGVVNTNVTTMSTGVGNLGNPVLSTGTGTGIGAMT